MELNVTCGFFFRARFTGNANDSELLERARVSSDFCEARISLDKRLISTITLDGCLLIRSFTFRTGWTGTVPDACSALRVYLTPPPALSWRLPDDPVPSRHHGRTQVDAVSFVDVCETEWATFFARETKERVIGAKDNRNVRNESDERSTPYECSDLRRNSIDDRPYVEDRSSVFTVTSVPIGRLGNALADWQRRRRKSDDRSFGHGTLCKLILFHKSACLCVSFDGTIRVAAYDRVALGDGHRRLLTFTLGSSSAFIDDRAR